MHDLTVPNLVAGTTSRPLGLKPIDNIRHALPMGLDGVAVAFIDVAPRAGLAIINPVDTRAVINPGAAYHFQGPVG